MADPMRLRRQAWLRAWKTGCQAPERTDGNDAASLVRLGICSWAEYFDPTGSIPAACAHSLTLAAGGVTLSNDWFDIPVSWRLETNDH
jgi:hypothetical protein